MLSEFPWLHLPASKLKQGGHFQKNFTAETIWASATSILFSRKVPDFAEGGSRRAISQCNSFSVHALLNAAIASSRVAA